MKPVGTLTIIAMAIAAPLLAAEPSAPAPQWSPPSASDLTGELPALAENDIGLMARFHFATHTVDFDRARAFYRMLGYTEGILYKLMETAPPHGDLDRGTCT